MQSVSKRIHRKEGSGMKDPTFKALSDHTGIVDGKRHIVLCPKVIERITAQWDFRHKSKEIKTTLIDNSKCPYCDGSGIIWVDGKEPA